MTDRQNSSITYEIAKNYYTTTARRSHSRDISWYKHASQQAIRRIIKWLPSDKNSHILEIGCGCGELLYGLEQIGYSQLTGIDFCQEELDEAKNFIKSKLICTDISDFLSTANEKCDVVIAYNILEHFDKNTLLNILQNIRQILNPGGKLIAMVPNAVSIMGSTTRYWDITHEMAFTTNNWYQLAALTGFDSTPEFRECGPVVHGAVSFIRYLIWRFIRIFIRIYLLCEVVSDRGGIYTQDMMVCLSASSANIRKL